MADTTERNQSHGEVARPVSQSADHVDIRVAGCPAQRGPTKTRQQRDRANPRRRVRAGSVAAESPPQRQQLDRGLQTLRPVSHVFIKKKTLKCDFERTSTTPRIPGDKLLFQRLTRCTRYR